MLLTTLKGKQNCSAINNKIGRETEIGTFSPISLVVKSDFFLIGFTL